MEKLTTCISGSFKFKPEIDLLCDEFNDLGVTVLEPTKGWLYITTQLQIPIGDFRPLPQERGLNHAQVENRFLDAVRRADFLFLYNPYSYLGLSASLEIGFATGLNKPVYAQNRLTLANFDNDIADHNLWSRQVTVATPAQTVRAMHELRG